MFRSVVAELLEPKLIYPEQLRVASALFLLKALLKNGRKRGRSIEPTLTREKLCLWYPKERSFVSQSTGAQGKIAGLAFRRPMEKVGSGIHQRQG